MKSKCCKASHKDLMLQDAGKKLHNELDIEDIIRTLRITKFIASVLTDQRQRKIVKYFDEYTPEYVPKDRKSLRKSLERSDGPSGVVFKQMSTRLGKHDCELVEGFNTRRSKYDQKIKEMM